MLNFYSQRWSYAVIGFFVTAIVVRVVCSCIHAHEWRVAAVVALIGLAEAVHCTRGFLKSKF